jgi:hypothetical protein
MRNFNLTTIVEGTNLTITVIPSMNPDGTTTPIIFKSQVPQTPQIIDTVPFVEGQLGISYQGTDPSVAGRIVNSDYLLDEMSGDDNQKYDIEDVDLVYNQVLGDPSPDYPDNIMENIGDEIVFLVNAQVRNGWVDLSSFLDTWSDRTGVQVLMRYTDFTFLWSDWMEVTSNVLDIHNLRPTNTLDFEIRCIKIGGEGITNILQQVVISGTFITKNIDNSIIDGSIFRPVVDTPEQLQYQNNFFKKLYFKGIIPLYMIRALNRSREEDEDYISFMDTIARFFSLIISFFKRWERFSENYDLLFENVQQQGLAFDKINTPFEDLLFLSSHWLDQIRQRGTDLIFRRKGEVLPSGNIMPIDGEFVRLLGIRPWDEFLYEIIPDYLLGWCMLNCSPMYMGTCDSIQLNKTGENTKDFVDINKFPIIGDQQPIITQIVSEGNKSVLLLWANGNWNGLGTFGTGLQSRADSMLVASIQLDYEVTFEFMISQASGTGSPLSTRNFSFGCKCFDRDKNLMQLVSAKDGSFSDNFINEDLSEFLQTDIWYKFRGIIFAHQSSNNPYDKTNLGFGNNLRFFSTNTAYIQPYIAYNAPAVQFGGYCFIWNYKVRPMVRGKNTLPLQGEQTNNAYSLGFIESKGWQNIIVANNNRLQSEAEITDFVNRYLISYSQHLNIEFLLG